MKQHDLKKLFPYTIGEDIANSISHGVAALIASVLNVYLIYNASISGNITAVITFALYGYAVLLMFLMSCLYHGIRHVTTRDVFKRLDHSFIFILILATYCPIVFVGLHSQLSYIIFILLSIITVLGVVFKVFFVGKFKIISTVIFIAMGWISVILIPQINDILPKEFLYFLIAGGLAYTLGAVVYALGKFKYHHFIWHLFVIAGVFLHYYGILFYLL